MPTARAARHQIGGERPEIELAAERPIEADAGRSQARHAVGDEARDGVADFVGARGRDGLAQGEELAPLGPPPRLDLVPCRRHAASLPGCHLPPDIYTPSRRAIAGPLIDTPGGRCNHSGYSMTNSAPPERAAERATSERNVGAVAGCALARVQRGARRSPVYRVRPEVTPDPE